MTAAGHSEHIANRKKSTPHFSHIFRSLLIVLPILFPFLTVSMIASIFDTSVAERSSPSLTMTSIDYIMRGSQGKFFIVSQRVAEDVRQLFLFEHKNEIGIRM
jgi:hypothetical protein